MRYQLGLYEKSMPDNLSIAEKLSAAVEAGYDYLELSIDESDAKLARLDWSKELKGELLLSMHGQGTEIKSICLSGHRRFPLGSLDAGTREKSLGIMSKAVKLASELGVKIIQLAGYDVYYEQSGSETREYFYENLSKSVEFAAREGVILAFETMETEFMDTVSKAMYWVDKINSPYLQIYPDIGNLKNASLIYNTDPAEDFRLGAGHIAAVHLKETAPGKYREMDYGTGHVDFSLMAKEAFDIGVRLFVGEFWYVGDENWKEILRQNNLFLRAALDGI